MTAVTITQRQLDEYTLRLGRLEDELAAAVLREAALEARVLEYLHALTELLEAADGIACYPEGAVGFDDLYDATAKARPLTLVAA